MKAEEIIQKKIEASREKIIQLESRIGGLCTEAAAALEEVEDAVHDGLDKELETIGVQANEECCEKAPGLPVFWDTDCWKDFEPIATLTGETLPDRLQVGFWVPADEDDDDEEEE